MSGKYGGVEDRAGRAVRHLWDLLHDGEIPELPEDLGGIALLGELHRDLVEIRRAVKDYAAWDLEPEIGDRRESRVKTLQEREQRFRYLASHDALTGALNRQSFFERAAVEFGVALAQNKRCCLAILDLDHFKAFNDRYGHLAGDEALKQVVRVLSAYLRREDFMGRYGGEEFVLFFRDTELGVCQRVCSRVLQKLGSMPLALGGKEAVYITASMGVATAHREDFEGGDMEPDAGAIVQKMLVRADAALYEAKNTGRNKVMSNTY